MKKIISCLLMTLPYFVFGQDTNQVDTANQRNMGTNNFFIRSQIGDTIVNLNSLNNGIRSYQIPDESKKIIENNGLIVKDGGLVIVKTDTLLKKDFSFDIKTFASDNEWYENTIKVNVGPLNRIFLINITSDKIEMATGFRKEGKIYVVVAVSMILFGIIILYLILMERKVRKLEKMLKEK